MKHNIMARHILSKGQQIQIKLRIKRVIPQTDYHVGFSVLAAYNKKL